MPKCAPDDTGSLVPLRGPNRLIGARMQVPASTPSTIAQTPALNDSPTSTGKLPSTEVEKVLQPPNSNLNRSIGRA